MPTLDDYQFNLMGLYWGHPDYQRHIIINYMEILSIYIYIVGIKWGLIMFNHQQMAKTSGKLFTSCHRALVATTPLQWTRDGVPGVQGEDLNQGVHPE